MNENSSFNYPVITVVTVVYNGVGTIEETIRSVIDQDYPNLEYIVVDGGSTDGTIDIIKRYASSITRWVSEKDRGIYDAMNKGIDMATGQLINFMNSGDRFASRDVLQRSASAWSNSDILYGDALIEFPTFKTKYKTHPLDQMWRRSPFCHQAAFARTSLMKEMKFDLNYKLGADYDFFFRSYRAGKAFQYMDLDVCIFEGDEGASKRQFINAMKELFRSSLTHEPKLSHWLYAKAYIAYAHALMFIKRLLGQRFVLWSKKLIQGRKQDSGTTL